MDEKNCYDEYIVSRDFLGEHKREHYDLKGDEVIFSSDPYVTFGDIYDNAVPLVRCGECKHRGTDDCPMHIKGVPANEGFLKVVDNDFCSYGERRSK